jgi:branched-chain amino acid transport system substrate-binding protein
LFKTLARVVAVGVIAVIGGAGLAACGSSTETVTIGALYPKTGTQGEGGTEELRGVRLAAEWANNYGAFGGRQYKLAEVDAARAEAVPAAMDTLAAKKVTVVVGSHGSAISAAAQREATAKKMAFFETGAVGQIAEDNSNGQNFFRMAPMGANLGRSAITFIDEQLGPKLPAHGPLRYAVANVDDAYGRAVAQGALDTIAERKLDLVGTFPYDAHNTDYAPLATKIAAAKPDVLFVAAYIDDGVGLRQEMVNQKVPLLAGIGTSSSYCMPEFGKRLGAEGVGLYASDKPDAEDIKKSALLPEGQRALEWAQRRYKNEWHKPMEAAALSGFSNAYALFVHVLPKAPNLQLSSVAKAALDVKLPEGSLANGGGLDLAPPGVVDAGANRRAAGVIEQWVAPGQKEVVWPPPFATRPVTVMPLA